MTKITLTNHSDGTFNQSAHNNNNALLEEALNDKVLYRDNPTGTANQMENDLDMNSNDILNAQSLFTQELYIEGVKASLTALSSTNIVKAYSTVADMAAATDLFQGDLVMTKGYWTQGDGGHAIYRIVAAATGTDDGFAYHNLSGITGQAELVEADIVNIRQAGAKGDGVTDDTAAIQAVIDSITATKEVQIPAGDFIVTGIDLSTLQANVHIRGVGNNIASGARVSSIRYSATGSTAAASAVFKITDVSTGYGSTFKNLNVDLNNRAKHGFLFVSGASFQAIKNMYFEEVYCVTIPDGGVGWRIGDQSNTVGLGATDLDSWNYTFKGCHARTEFAATNAGAGAIGWVVDAQNAYNISWKDCSDGGTGAGGMLCGIKTLRGSGYRVFNYFSSGGKSSALSGGSADTENVWAIDHKAGSMNIYGLNTEDFRLVRARTNGEHDASLVFVGGQINDPVNLTDTDYSIYSEVVTKLDSIFLTNAGAGLINKKIKCTVELVASQVNMGAGGAYELSKPYACTLEGVKIGQLDQIGPNPSMHSWEGTASDEVPFGWKKTTLGNATFTIIQDTANEYIGRNTCKVNVTVANSSTADVTGIQMVHGIEASAHRGKVLYAYAVVTGDTTKAELEIDNLPAGATFATSSYDTTYNDGSTACTVLYGVLDLTAVTGALTTLQLKVGIRQSQTGTLYIDAAGISPVNFSGYIPALAIHAQYPIAQTRLDEVNSGYLPVGNLTQTTGAASPTTGTWTAGDVVWNIAPTINDYVGWVCVTTGSPGTWLPFGYLENKVTTATTAELEDVTDAINTGAAKVEGYMVFNTDTNKPVWAVGSTDGNVWVDATGATAHTPV